MVCILRWKGIENKHQARILLFFITERCNTKGIKGIKKGEEEEGKSTNEQ